ncbi:MAG: hypothetical protein AUK48_07490 [Oscillatoriales cyanobacterium CG2_30_44_21]|nr:MAG: hypothetical protein AUK48_07490 [Oscillatoriales cyanobacterium CG2_30_44_21]
MSQAGFGDSSSQESISLSELESQFSSGSSNLVDEPSTLFKALPRQLLEQELRLYNERSQQAQVLLRQAQEQLQLSQLVIQRQETLTLTLQSRIDQLERELQDTHSNCDELRDRLKRQQHHTSQLKAALERCLDTSTTTNIPNNDLALSALESWSIAKLADEKISPVESIGNDAQLQNVIKISPTLPEPDHSDSSPSELSLVESTTSKQDQQQQQPVNLPIPPKSQPISPLIVRPHKASHGSPIAPNLPALQSVGESAGEPNLSASHDSCEFGESSIASGHTLAKSSVVATVATPKFMQSLYSNHHEASSEPEEPEFIAVAANSRKAVTSLAAVQLPQFPPLPRRQRW